MSWDKGWNFRATSGYVTDGANTTYELGEQYPVTRNTVTFGWVGFGPLSVDRNNALDVRLAGINYFSSSGVTGTFQVDLPATGDYTIHLALGDAGGGGSASCVCVIKDNASTLATINFDASVGTKVTDATGTLLNTTTWPGSEAGASLTFATTTLSIALTSPSLVMIEHLFVSQAGAASGGGPLIGGELLDGGALTHGRLIS